MTDSVETVETQPAKNPLTEDQILLCKKTFISFAGNLNGLLDLIDVQKMMENKYCNLENYPECNTNRISVLNQLFLDMINVYNNWMVTIEQFENVFAKIRRMELTLKPNTTDDEKFELFKLMDTKSSEDYGFSRPYLYMNYNEFLRYLEYRYGPNLQNNETSMRTIKFHITAFHFEMERVTLHQFDTIINRLDDKYYNN